MRLLSPPTSTSYYHHHQQQQQQQHYCSFSFNNNNKKKPKQQLRWVPRMDSTTTITTVHHHQRNKKEKIIVIMGATGTGKSKLSIDLATIFNAEIINSDKIQLYRGLDITTNKIPIHQRKGIKHHLLGDFDGELTPLEFRSLASSSVNDVVSRKKLPFLVGGSNSLIHAFLVDTFNPESNVFHNDSVSSDLRYKCCFLWVDLSFPLLSDYLCKRVDDMLDSGMFEELAEFYQNDNDDSVSRRFRGLMKAIGVPEFSSCFKEGDDRVRRGVLYEEAVREIKENTCRLAKRQIGKIKRLRGGGWDLRRLDATEVIRRVMTSDDEEWRDIWERDVLEPSVKIVKRFLE